MYIKTTGLVLRETAYKESSRILTVLTQTEGKITVSARGAKRRGSKTAASTQLLAFSEMTLFSQRDRYTLTEASGIELFLGLREDIRAMALGSYFAEVLEAAADTDIPNPMMLSLGLNCLYALSENMAPVEKIKAVFELRLMCLMGFEPRLDACEICGKSDPDVPVLSLAGGVIHCAGCGALGYGEEMALTPGVLDAMRYIVGCDMKRLLSFSIGAEAQRQLARVCEAYLLAQLGRGFGTLDFYKTLA